jgi:hypothetical protein
MELSPSREVATCSATQELPQDFKEPENSLPCSQGPPPSTGLCPEPD